MTTSEILRPPDEAETILREVFPRLCNDLAMLLRRPFRLVWDPTTETASTDCQAEVRLAPWFFLNGHPAVGFGTAYHESGHILHSPYGSQLLEEAERQGGQNRRHLLNIILDRKDDMWTAEEAPGFAEILRRRLAYICTLHRRAKAKQLLPHLPEDEALKMLRSMPAEDLWVDFFFAAKWGKRPRFRQTHRAMKYLSRRRLLRASPPELLWMAEKVHHLLGERPEGEHEQNRLAALMVLIASIEQGGPVSPRVGMLLAAISQAYVAAIRATGLGQLIKWLNLQGIVYPGPVSVGVVSSIKVKEIRPDPAHQGANRQYEAAVQCHLEPLLQKLRLLDTPAEFVITGQDEGELDLDDSWRIATGLGGHCKQTVTERDIDADIHLAVDCSSSMTGEKVEKAKQIVAIFKRAIQTLHPALTGRIWAFSSAAIYDFGEPCDDSAYVTIAGEVGNSDTHLLRHVGQILARSQKRRRILLMLCDDGPDSMEEAARLSNLLLARGILVAHLLVNVHGTPQIYPFELPFSSIDECLREFGGLLETIVRHLK